MHAAASLALVVVAAAAAGVVPIDGDDAAAGATTVRMQRPRARCEIAIALRDNVPFEQKLGTQAFTVPLLASSYDAFTYVTAADDDDGRSAIVGALSEARTSGCDVDLFFLAHGHEFVRWVEQMPEDERPRLRLVYDTGGGDAWQGQHWIDVGARAFVGHPGANLAPVFYAFFLPAWLSGSDVDGAVRESNKRTFVVIDAARPYLGNETGALWRGTRALVFGNGRVKR